MTIVKQVEDWKSSVFMVLDSKVEELILMDYPNATRESVWNCLVEKVWKGNPEKRLFQIVEDILHLSASKYMSYLTMQSYQNEDLMASIAAIGEMNEVK